MTAMKKIYQTPKIKLMSLNEEMLCADSGGGNAYLGTEINDDETESKYGSDYDHGAW